MVLISGIAILWLAREVYRADNPTGVDYDEPSTALDILAMLALLCMWIGGAILFVVLLLAVFF